MKQQKNYWVYILLCENNSYYTGYTTDLLKRFYLHLKGTDSCKYTRGFKPLRIVQCWKITGNKSLAMKVECYIKKLSRIDKEKIIINPSILSSEPPLRLTKSQIIEPFAFGHH